MRSLRDHWLAASRDRRGAWVAALDVDQDSDVELFIANRDRDSWLAAANFSERLPALRRVAEERIKGYWRSLGRFASRSVVGGAVRVG